MKHSRTHSIRRSRTTAPQHRKTTERGVARPVLQPLEPRKLLSASPADIASALDLPDGVVVTYTGHDDAIGVYENYSVEGLLGMPSGPDGDYFVMSTASAFDAVRTTDRDSKANTTRYRDLGNTGVADDFATITFTLDVTPSVYNQRLLIDFIYASDADTDGGDYFDIIVNGINIADANDERIQAGGKYVTNERDPDLEGEDPGYGLEIDTEYSDLLTASYTVPDGTTSLEITITIADSNDPEHDACALVDNVRFEQTQVVFLDFDGHDIGDFFLRGTDYQIDSFDANDFGLGSDFADVIQTDLESIFDGLDIQFVTSEPTSGDFMRVVIGGENRDTVNVADVNGNEWILREVDHDTTPTFKQLFNLVNFRDADGNEAAYGLADRLDLGNENQSDIAVVFAKQIARDGYAYSHLRDSIAHYIGRNLGLRAESNAFTNSVMAENIAVRGSQFEDASHGYHGEDWGDLEALGLTQNARQVLLDNLGSSTGDVDLRNAWTDARRLNQAHWTIAQPTRNDLYDAEFTIIGDKHTRTVTTVVPVWKPTQVLITDFAGKDPNIVISAARSDGKRHDYETIGPKNLGQFTAVQDDARFTQIGLWEVVGSGAFFQGSATLIQTEAGANSVYYSDYEFTDTDGDIVKISLNTLNGLFAVSEGDHGPVITLAETLGSRDSLKITVNRKSGGDGRATIGGLQGSGLKSIKATDVDFSGTGVDLASLSKGKFASVLDGTDFNVRLDEGESADYQFDMVSGDSHFVLGRETKKLRAESFEAGVLVFDTLSKIDMKNDITVAHLSVRDGQSATVKVKGNVGGGAWEFWGETRDNGKDIKDSLKKFDVKESVLTGFSLTAFANANQIKTKGGFDGDVTAKALDKFQINGDWSGTMTLTDDGTDFNRSSKQIKVKGLAQNVFFAAQNDVDQIYLGAAESSNFYIGFDDSVTSGVPVDLSLMTNPGSKVKKVKMTGVKDVAHDYIDSVISAGDFKNIDLGDVDGDNGGVPFGVSAISINKIAFDTGTGRITQKNEDAFNDNDAADDFFIGQIT